MSDGSLTWQDILDARGYVIIVPTSQEEQERIRIGAPIPFIVVSGNMGNLEPGSLVPIIETTYADFLVQANMYTHGKDSLWCGETDRYYRCVAE